jgi:hypothetical protein
MILPGPFVPRITLRSLIRVEADLLKNQGLTDLDDLGEFDLLERFGALLCRNIGNAR